MTTKELLHAEIDHLGDEAVDELYRVARTLSSERPQASASGPGLLTRLQEIKIHAPEDFAANLDLYLSGEKIAP